MKFFRKLKTNVENLMNYSAFLREKRDTKNKSLNKNI